MALRRILLVVCMAKEIDTHMSTYKLWAFLEIVLISSFHKFTHVIFSQKLCIFFMYGNIYYFYLSSLLSLLLLLLFFYFMFISSVIFIKSISILVVFHWSLIGLKFLQVSRILPSILADISNTGFDTPTDFRFLQSLLQGLQLLLVSPSPSCSTPFSVLWQSPSTCQSFRFLLFSLYHIYPTPPLGQDMTQGQFF